MRRLLMETTGCTSLRWLFWQVDRVLRQTTLARLQGARASR